MLCSPGTTFARGSRGKKQEELEVSRCCGTLSSTSPCLNSCSQSGKPYNWSLFYSSSSSFLFWFSMSADLCNGFPVLMIPRSHFPLLLVAGISVSVTVSCDEGVREVDEVEELLDKPRYDEW